MCCSRKFDSHHNLGNELFFECRRFEFKMIVFHPRIYTLLAVQLARVLDPELKQEPEVARILRDQTAL
jgi:hypothetical protein